MRRREWTQEALVKKEVNPLAGKHAGLDKKAVFEKVKAIVVDRLGVEESQVTPDATFIDDLDADSLDIVELIMAIEEEFDLEIPDEDAEKIATVADAVEYIVGNL